MASEGGNGSRLKLEKPAHAGAVFGEGAIRGLGGLGGSVAGPIEEVHVFWLAGMSCDGCSVAVTGATSPSVEDLLAGTIPNLPRVILHHPVLSVAAGAEFTRPFREAVNGELGAPYVVVLEGSVPDDQALPEDQGYYSAMGAGGFDPDSRGRPAQPHDRLAQEAGSRSGGLRGDRDLRYLGGIPAAAGNVTGSMSLMDFLGKDYRSALGVPVVNVPGCSPVGDNFTETVAAVLMFLEGLGPLPEFDELGRPAWLFEQTVHRHCVRAGYYEEGTFAKHAGDQECLVDLGCWGPVVQCNITERGAINHMGGCMVAGGACIGCTMPGFPDKFSPFYKAPPGSAISGGFSRGYGSVIRRLRRMTQSGGNTEPLWDQLGEVPSPYSAERRKPALLTKAGKFFYHRLQYSGTVNQEKRYRDQPVPKSLNILDEGVQQEIDRYRHGDEATDVEVQETASAEGDG